MDCLRSRTFCWSSIFVVSLVACSFLIYSTFKKPEENVRNADEETNLNEISDFNPLEDEGFKRETDWSEFPRTDGPLSASAADFLKGEECRRVVVFLGRGTVLGHILTACDTMDPSMGLMMVDDILYYYGRAMEKQGPTEEMFTVAKKVIGERKCVVTSYSVNGDHRPKVVSTSEPKEVVAYENKDCKTLVDFKMPPMLLLSRNGMTGKFTPGKSSFWATVNPWEALGALTRLYWNQARCFRLLVITSYGRSVQAVKVSCGPVENLVATDNALYYGDALVVKRNSEANTFVLIYNSKRSGDCFKKTVMLRSKEGRTGITVLAQGYLGNKIKECQDLVNGVISGAVVNKVEVSHVVRKLKANDLEVEPYGGSLQGYNPYSQWSYFNLPMDLGLAVTYYKAKDGQSIRKLLLVIARGVPVAGVFVDTGPIRRLVMRPDALYHDSDIMLRKTKEGKYVSLVKVDEYNCLKKSFTLTDENGVTVKKELPSGGKVTKSMDEDCRDLIDGKKLKNPEIGNFNHETDDFGVPKDLPEGVKVSGESAAETEHQETQPKTQ